MAAATYHGTACRRCGGTERYVNGKKCVPCTREAKRKRRAKPEVREAEREAKRRYDATPERREAARKRHATEEGREAQRNATRKYLGKPEGREAARKAAREHKRRWRATPEGRQANREAARKYRATPEGREATRETDRKRRATPEGKSKHNPHKALRRARKRDAIPPHRDTNADRAGIAAKYAEAARLEIQSQDRCCTRPVTRLGPTNRHTGLEPQQRLPCSKCKAHFVSYQVIRINGKQLCIWCAGHSVKLQSRAFTVHSSSAAYKR